MANPEAIDVDRLVADHLAGDEAAGEALAELVTRDPQARRQVSMHLALDRALNQLRAPAIDIAQVLRALPQARTSSMPSRVLSQIARREAQRRWKALVPLAAAALVMIGVFGLLWRRPAQPSLESVAPEVALSSTPMPMPMERAILRSSPHAQWPHQHIPVDAAGRVTASRIDLRAGLAELELPSGATLVLQGPTVLDLTGVNSARLLLGRLTAYVPPRAVGFILRAEGVQVVDRGTAFGIGQDVGGIAELHVFAGAVEAATRIDGIETVRRLHADEAVRIDPRGGSWMTVPCDPSRFIHGLRPRGLTLDLADLVAGGDGFGTAAADGIDPLSGELFTGPATGILRETQPVYRRSRNPCIDGVFIPDGSRGDTVIDSSGRRFRFPNTAGAGYDIIRRGGTYDTPQHGGRPQQPGIPPIFGGIDYRAPGHNALGMHASVGMSVDLQDVAYRHPGLRVDRFSAMAANVGRKGSTGRADIWVLLDGELMAYYQGVTPDTAPIALDLRIAADQRFLTLVSTDGGNGNGLDWITLGDPKLHLVEAR